MILVARSELHHMMPRTTLRFDRQPAFGFGRHAAGASTPTGALTGDVCPTWPTSAAVTPMSAAGAIRRDRTVRQQGQTRTEAKLVNGEQYTPSLQSQSKFGAGTEGRGRSTS
jgi:hypothetical protein